MSRFVAVEQRKRQAGAIGSIKVPGFEDAPAMLPFEISPGDAGGHRRWVLVATPISKSSSVAHCDVRARRNKLGDALPLSRPLYHPLDLTVQS
jgi:hypothetical protein